MFSPNYRGSNNMGDRFQSAVLNDADDGPGRDVMSGIAALNHIPMDDPPRADFQDDEDIDHPESEGAYDYNIVLMHRFW